MPKGEVLEFSEGLEEQNKTIEREEILKKLNVPNIIEVYANLSLIWRADKRLALAVIIRDGLALHYASAELQNDPEVVEAAVANTELAWPFASNDMQARRFEIMARIESKLKSGRAERITELQRETQREMEASHEYSRELERIKAIITKNFWKSPDPEKNIRIMAKELAMDPKEVWKVIEEAHTPEILVKVSNKPLVEALDQKKIEMYCLLEALKEAGFTPAVWTLGNKKWQLKKLELTGAKKYFDEEHIFVAENEKTDEKTSELRRIFDKILEDKSRGRPIHVYIVDDKQKEIDAAMGLSQVYEQQGIIIHNFRFDLKNSQADGTKFYGWILEEREKHSNLVLVLDFDQVIADTNGALDQACKNILIRKSKQEKQESDHAMAA